MIVKQTSRPHLAAPLRALLIAAPLVLVALFPASIVAAPPAGDEYGAAFPDARGKKGGEPSQPVARPNRLPPSTVRALASDPQGQALITAATATELGAPEGRAPASQTGESAAAGSEGDESAPAAVTHALATRSALLVLLGVGGLVALGFAARRTRGEPS